MAAQIFASIALFARRRLTLSLLLFVAFHALWYTPASWSQTRKPIFFPGAKAKRNAASLLAGFILSPRGQKIFGELDFVDPKDSRLNRFYPERGLTSTQYDDQMSRWLKLLRERRA